MTLLGCCVMRSSSLEVKVRYRNVTTWARVHRPSGLKVEALVPEVMLFSTAQSTGLV